MAWARFSEFSILGWLLVTSIQRGLLMRTEVKHSLSNNWVILMIFITSCSLTDLRSVGTYWSQNNKCMEGGRIIGRLDRSLCNSKWLDVLPLSYYEYLSHSSSDHAPCLLNWLVEQILLLLPSNSSTTSSICSCSLQILQLLAAYWWFSKCVGWSLVYYCDCFPSVSDYQQVKDP